ncbi:MAG TPA: helix-turn-helix transcriptional regulator [Stellaceae bacterium]|nr:helix-turn-helix transcriptional regulator [Stellaceae bacterium]
MNNFQSRFRDALRRRLYPNTSLHLKQLSRLVGRSENTVSRWWRGETHISAEDFYALAELFCAHGDASFLNEIFGGLLGAKAGKPEVESDALALIRKALAEVGNRAEPNRDTYSWFKTDGTISAAPSGHAELIRREIGIPESAGDLSAYALRVLGWLSLTERTDGVVVIRHDGRRVAPLGAERICEWLEDQDDRISHVRRVVHMDGKWIEANHNGARAAAAAIARVAFITRLPRRPWTVTPLPIDSITDRRLVGLMRAYHQAPDRLIHAAADMGALTTSNVFGVHGDDVVSHHVATAFGPGLDPRTIIGYNVLSRADIEYGLMVQARILRARRDGPGYHELSGFIDDNRVRYLNLSLPEAGESGRVLTSTVILELDQIAA